MFIIIICFILAAIFLLISISCFSTAKGDKVTEEKAKALKSNGKGFLVACIIWVIGATVLINMGVFDSEPAHTPSSNNQTHQNHECYVCGDDASLKYGSHYYCDTHWAMVKTMDEAD